MVVSPNSVCLQLGNTSDTTTNAAKVVTASTPQDIEASRQGILAASMDQLVVVVSAADLATLYNPMELANWVPLLKEKASVTIKVLGPDTDLTPIHTSFLLAGLAGISEQKTLEGRTLTAIRKTNTTAAAAAVPLKKQNAVTISLDDNDNDQDMIDEDALLSDDLLAPPPAMGAKTAATDDCAGRKPCDDCTCGRADAEKSNQEQAPKSSCGKCHLGDAFRCASCPYLGKPAFKPGEEHLVLDLMDDL